MIIEKIIVLKKTCLNKKKITNKTNEAAPYNSLNKDNFFIWCKLLKISILIVYKDKNPAKTIAKLNIYIGTEKRLEIWFEKAKKIKLKDNIAINIKA